MKLNHFLLYFKDAYDFTIFMVVICMQWLLLYGYFILQYHSLFLLVSFG